jgi:hypothetical protein
MREYPSSGSRQAEATHLDENALPVHDMLIATSRVIERVYDKSPRESKPIATATNDEKPATRI